MNKKHIEILLPLVCIVLAFFLGYFFSQRELFVNTKTTSGNIKYIDISTSKNSITIKNTPDNIFFRVNGEVFQTGSIDLK